MNNLSRFDLRQRECLVRYAHLTLQITKEQRHNEIYILCCFYGIGSKGLHSLKQTTFIPETPNPIRYWEVVLETCYITMLTSNALTIYSSAMCCSPRPIGRLEHCQHARILNGALSRASALI